MGPVPTRSASPFIIAFQPPFVSLLGWGIVVVWSKSVAAPLCTIPLSTIHCTSACANKDISSLLLLVCFARVNIWIFDCSGQATAVSRLEVPYDEARRE